MADKVWLTNADVGTRFGTTRQWVWVQARTNPNFPQPAKLTARCPAGHHVRMSSLKQSC